MNFKLIYYSFLVFYILYAGFMLARVVIQQQFSTDGIEVGKLQAEIKQIQTENDRLRVQIYDATSYRVISEKAKALGFVEAKDFIYLK